MEDTLLQFLGQPLRPVVYEIVDCVFAMSANKRYRDAARFDRVGLARAEAAPGRL
jgi:hypothetical protein